MDGGVERFKNLVAAGLTAAYSAAYIVACFLNPDAASNLKELTVLLVGLWAAARMSKRDQ
ncbi:MAG: hypothetical protein ACYTG5_21125 [Planctomycetota bacterium]|jgi:hypothetical protein